MIEYFLAGLFFGALIEAVPALKPVTRTSTYVYKKGRSYVKAIKEFF